MIVALLLGLQSCVIDKEEPDFSLSPGERIPEFSVSLTDGSVIDISALKDSGLTNLIIVFFNTDCGDCRRDLPELQKFYDRIQENSGLRESTLMLCIAREEGEDEILRFWKENNLSLPVSPQPDRKIYNLFASVGIPRLFLVSVPAMTIVASLTPDDFNLDSLLPLMI